MADAWRCRATPTRWGSRAQKCLLPRGGRCSWVCSRVVGIAEVVRATSWPKKRVRRESREGRRARERGLARSGSLPNGGSKLRAKRGGEPARGGETARPGKGSARWTSHGNAAGHRGGVTRRWKTPRIGEADRLHGRAAEAVWRPLKGSFERKRGGRLRGRRQGCQRFGPRAGGRKDNVLHSSSQDPPKRIVASWNARSPRRSRAKARWPSRESTRRECS